MHTETSVHSGKDSMCRPIVPGLYAVTNKGETVTCLVTEDPDNGELGVVINRTLHLLSDLDPACVLSRMNNLKRAPMLADVTFVDNVLARARRHREALSQLESALSVHLGCDRGDGSPVWDGISAAVRDGLGSAVDLLDLAGER